MFRSYGRSPEYAFGVTCSSTCATGRDNCFPTRGLDKCTQDTGVLPEKHLFLAPVSCFVQFWFCTKPPPPKAQRRISCSSHKCRAFPRTCFQRKRVLSLRPSARCLQALRGDFTTKESEHQNDGRSETTEQRVWLCEGCWWRAGVRRSGAQEGDRTGERLRYYCR